MRIEHVLLPEDMAKACHLVGPTKLAKNDAMLED